MKAKRQYQCQSCGAVHSKWAGQCADCEAWNTLEETVVEIAAATSQRFQSYSGERADVTALGDVVAEQETRMTSGIGELDRVLGGGMVAGSVVLIGGDPGIGKSTLLLQSLAAVTQTQGLTPLYVSGEESASQIALRAERLHLDARALRLLTETNVDRIIEIAKKERSLSLIHI